MSEQVNSVCVLKSDLYASASEDKTIRIWNTKSKCVISLNGHKDSVWKVKPLLSIGFFFFFSSRPKA